MHGKWYYSRFLFLYEENTWRIHAKLKLLPTMTREDSSTTVRYWENTGLRLAFLIFVSQKKKINTLEREQKNKPLKRLMNFKSAAH